MSHLYQCHECNEFFTTDDTYDDDPETRKCLACGEGEGNIAYHGYQGYTGQIISDSLADVKNPINGKTYDSKSQYYKAVKDAGCTVVGNDAPKIPKKYSGDHNVRPELRQAVREVLSKQPKRKTKWKTIN